MQRHTLKLKGPFPLEAGGCLEDIEIAYHTSPREYVPGDKVIWICHALTADSDVEDWWKEMVGAGRPVDTEKYFVVCVNMLGSPYGTTSPASINPASGRPYMLDFPQITIRDIVRTFIEVRKALGINTIDLIVGASIGGFQAIEWAIMEADRIRHAAFIATGSRISPYLTAYEESQRMALEADPSFLEAKDLSGGTKGLRCARSIALISYRSYDGYNNTQAEENPDTLFASRACSYQRYQGKKLSDRFDAYCYWALSVTLDSHNVGRGRDGVEAALGRIKADTLVVGINSDCLFAPKDMKKIAEAIPGARYAQIESSFGHDGFLLEFNQLTKLLTPLIED